MKDDFKRAQFKDIGPGGFRCPCCNNSRGKSHSSHVGALNILNKKARLAVKADTKREAQAFQEE